MKNNIINEYTKRRLVSLALATSITATSLGLTGCAGKKIENNPYGTNEKYNVCDNFLNDASTIDDWFCDVWVEGDNDKILGGAKFELRDEAGNLVDSWTSSSSEAHRIEKLKDGIYILKEVSTPVGYVLSGSKNTWTINPKSGWKCEVLPIRNTLEKEYANNNVNNILNTGKKEYINCEYFVLNLEESYKNSKDEDDFIHYNDNIPKYILLKGTQADGMMTLANSNSVQYEFGDIFEDNYIPRFEETDVSMNYNGDGYYYITVWRSYCGIVGRFTNDNLYIKPLYDLTREELEELMYELKDNQDMLEKLYQYDDSYVDIKPKTKTLTK